MHSNRLGIDERILFKEKILRCGSAASVITITLIVEDDSPLDYEESRSVERAKIKDTILFFSNI